MAKRKASKAAESGSSKKAVAEPSKSQSPQAVGKVYQALRTFLWVEFGVQNHTKEGPKSQKQVSGFHTRGHQMTAIFDHWAPLDLYLVMDSEKA